MSIVRVPFAALSLNRREKTRLAKQNQLQWSHAVSHVVALTRAMNTKTAGKPRSLIGY